MKGKGGEIVKKEDRLVFCLLYTLLLSHAHTFFSRLSSLCPLLVLSGIIQTFLALSFPL